MKIDERHCGPPGSAHGGVAVGRFAELVDTGPVEVRLLGPPPLGTDLDTRNDPDGAIIFSGPDGDVARVRPLAEEVEVQPFALVTEAELDSAAAQYLRGVDEDGHPFPACFCCGPDRLEGDGLRQFAGPTPSRDTVAARFFVEGDGPVPQWLVWAGLDCPSGHAVGLAEDSPSALVLGTMSGQVEGDIQAGVDYQVRGRLLASEGRKHGTEVAMLAPDGTTVGAARAVWITVDPTQF